MIDWRSATKKESDKRIALIKNAKYLDRHDTDTHFILKDDIILTGFTSMDQAKEWEKQMQTSLGGFQETRTRRSIQKEINGTD